MSLEGWELPDFGSDLEPRELKRIRCSECVVAFAAVFCTRCALHYCDSCEDSRHHAMSDTDEHRDELDPCNVCSVCEARSSFFYCRECEQNQCEPCCSTTHAANEAAAGHVWFCTEGTPSELLRYNTWSESFKERVKLARYKRFEAMEAEHHVVKQEAGALPDYLPLSPADDDDEATSDEEDLPAHAPEQPEQAAATDSVQIKMERVRLNSDQDAASAPARAPEAPSAAAPAVPEVTIKREPPRPDLRQHYQQSQAGDSVQIKTERPTASRSRQQASSKDVVDLTGDDDEDDTGAHAGAASTTLPTVKSEPLATVAAPTSHPEPVLTSSFAEEDPFRTAMIDEYIKQSAQVGGIQQQMAALSAHSASSSVQELVQLRQQHEALKNTLAKAVHRRNATVARLLVYLHGDAAATLVADAVADIPQAQEALHRLAADAQTKIDARLAALQHTKRQLEEAIAMKAADAYAELRRLGAAMAELESEIRALERERLDALRQLCAVSQQVRTAILAVLASTSGGPS